MKCFFAIIYVDLSLTSGIQYTHSRNSGHFDSCLLFTDASNPFCINEKKILLLKKGFEKKVLTIRNGYISGNIGISESMTVCMALPIYFLSQERNCLNTPSKGFSLILFVACSCICEIEYENWLRYYYGIFLFRLVTLSSLNDTFCSEDKFE